MAKVKVYSVNKKEKQKITEELFELIADFKNKDEVDDFLSGLLTESEVLMIARRIQVAKMILNEDGYDVIRKKLKVSFYNINRIERWLKENEDKLKLIVIKFKKIKKDKEKQEFRGALDKYAHHRLTKNILTS